VLEEHLAPFRRDALLGGLIQERGLYREEAIASLAAAITAAEGTELSSEKRSLQSMADIAVGLLRGTPWEVDPSMLRLP
jgi:hypothetical protein